MDSGAEMRSILDRTKHGHVREHFSNYSGMVKNELYLIILNRRQHINQSSITSSGIDIGSTE